MAKGYVGTPSSYTPVEYIESSGTQYIDTGLKTNEISRIEAVASNTFGLNYQGITYGNSLFGARVSASNSNFQYANGAYNEFFGNGTAQLSITRNTSTNILTITYSKTSYNITSTNYNVNGSLSVTIATPLDIYVFGLNNNGANAGGTWKVYTFKMYDTSNNLVRNYIPVVDQSNVACLYDLVQGNLYYNQGTGSFTAGTAGTPVSIGDRARKITEAYVGVPMAYTPVEYIESSGTQYIDTEYTPVSNSKIIANIMQLTLNNSNYGSIMGNSTGGLRTFVASGYIRQTIGSTDQSSTTAVSLNTKYQVTLNDNGTSYWEQTIGAKIGFITGTPSTITSTSTFEFFSQSGGAIWGTARLYDCKIYENDILIRDFIPVLDENNVACLYEQVEGKFYYNKGTGTFTAGSATGQAVSIGSKARRIARGYVGINGVARLIFNTYTPVEYIESSGTQYIDTGVVYDYATTQFDIDFQYLSSDNSGYISVSWSGSNHDAYVLGSNSSGSIICGTAQIDSWTPIKTKDANRHQYTYNNSSHQIIYDGSVISNRTTVNVNGVVTMRIFRGPGSNNPAKARIYGYKISNIVTQELIRDFIPVLDDSGVPCLYDKVSHTFFYNQGTGTFNYGTINSLNTASLMNTGSLVGMGDRAELTSLATELTDNNVGEIKVKEVTPLETTEEKAEGSGDIL